MRVFLAFAFHDVDRELVGYVDQLLGSQYVQALTGEGLGGEALTPAVQARIDRCDALIGLLTQRERIQDGRFTTHPWVVDELGYARAHKMRAIAVVESGLDVAGMYHPHEYIPLERNKPLPAFLRLSETIGEWKREVGRTVKVQILPAALARRVVATKAKFAAHIDCGLKGRPAHGLKSNPSQRGAEPSFGLTACRPRAAPSRTPK